MVHADGSGRDGFIPICSPSDVPGYRVRSIRMLSRSFGSSLPGDQEDRLSARGGIVPARGTDRSSVIRAFGGCLGIERR